MYEKILVGVCCGLAAALLREARLGSPPNLLSWKLELENPVSVATQS